ncbi:MAG: hypothetical protein JRJ29_00225, partial [Deltaproteobacteria bacterium]|nr:hypothetical protein [Deltaproteobacteria bacterium]MBW2081589.1 hypothetical protein [Deltaproteobacteria bacterium]
YAPWIILTNGVDNPVYWAGSGNLSALGGSPPKGKCISAFGGHVFISNLINDYTQRDQRSNVDDAEDWSGGTAGTVDLREDAGDIQGDLIFGDIRYIIKENSIAICRSTGYDPPFRYDDNYAPIGCPAPKTIIKCWLYDRGFFLGSDLNCYLIAKDGHYYPIGDDIADRIRDWGNDDTLKYSFAFYYPKLDSIILAVPANNNTSGWAVRMFAFDMGHYIRTGETIWSTKIQTGKKFTAAAEGRFREHFKIGNLEGTIGDLDGNIGDYYSDAAFSQVLVGDNDGYVYKFDPTLDSFDGTTIDWVATFMDYKLAGKFARQFRLQEYRLMFRKEGDVTATVKVSTNGGKTYPSSCDIDMYDDYDGADNEEVDGVAWFDVFGKKHRIKIEGSGNVAIEGQRFYGVDEGIR